MIGSDFLSDSTDKQVIRNTNTKDPTLGKSLNNDDIAKLYAVTSKGITLSALKELFAYRANSNPLFTPADTFTLPKGRLYNDENVKTSVGRYVFNKLILNDVIGPLVKYQNIQMNGKGVGKLDGIMASLLRSDTINSKEFETYIDKMQWIGFAISRFINPSLPTDMVIPPKDIVEGKQKLVEKNRKRLDDGDIEAVNEIESELLGKAKAEMHSEPAMEIYDSGSRGSFNNNYKMVNISRGVVPDPVDSSKVHISMNNLAEGIPPEEQTIYANISTIGSSSRAIATRDGGYVA